MIKELRSFGEVISDVQVASKLLQSFSSKFDSIITSIEQFQDLDIISLEEVMGTLKVHKDKLKDQSTKIEEKALLTKVFIKTKKKDCDNSSGRGCGRG